MQKENIIIEVQHLTYKNILKDINMKVKKGDFIGIAGTNTSGKTTLMKVLSTGINVPNTLIYDGKKLEETNRKTLYENIGLIFPEEKQIFENKTVEDELFSILENLPLKQEEKINRYQKIIKLIKIEEILTQNPNELTKINYLKLLLSTNLISLPSTILLDNICANIPKKETKEILEILKKINKEEKITIVMATNNLNETLDTDYLYILDKGTIAMEGKNLDILKQDNKLNKLGLELPLMVDLSVKLQDYDLLNEIILDMDRMVNTLWK